MGLFDKLFSGGKSDPSPAPAPSAPLDPVANFWAQFSANLPRVEPLLVEARKGARHRALLEPIRVWLTHVDADIGHDMIVGANAPVEIWFLPGRMDSVAKARALVAAAPATPGWLFGVRSPRNPDPMIEVADGFRIGVASLGFVPMKSEKGGLAVVVAIPDILGGWPLDQRLGIARKAIAHVIGERDQAQWVSETMVVNQSGADENLVVNGGDFAAWFDQATRAG